MRRWLLVAATAALIAPAVTAVAQRPLSLGLAGGVSVPQGGLGDVTSTGWHALGTVALSTMMQPIGLRLDVQYNRFAFSDQARAAAGGAGHRSVGSATLNVSYRLPMTDSPFSPYLIAGLGAYRSACSLGPACEAATRYGWNAGLGARTSVLPFRTFLEARYHRTTRGGVGMSYFPVTLGLLL